MKSARALAAVALVAIMALLPSHGLQGQDKEKTSPAASKKAAKGKLPPGWDRLDLTDAQRDEVVKLTADYEAKLAPLREEVSRLTAELARKRVALLTDEQKKKLVELATADPPKDRPKEKDKGGPGERPKEKPKAKGDPDK